MKVRLMTTPKTLRGILTLNADLSNLANLHGVPSALHPPLKKQTSIGRAAFVHTLRQDAIAPHEPPPSATLELGHVPSHATCGSPHAGVTQDHDSPPPPIFQGVPPELRNLLAEVIFVLTCSGGQLVSALLIGHVAVTQAVFGDALGIPPSQIPWLLGSSSLAAGLSVIISGSLADLTPPKPLMVGGFLWAAVWNVVAAVAISPRLKILFFVARAMQGLAAGVLVSASMSILGRVYKPGIRKTRVFSLMAAFSPFGYWLGCLQAGALSSHLPWIFGSTAIFLAGCTLAAQLTIPPLPPAKDSVNTEAPSLRQFDYLGAGLASIGCSLIIFGLTQGSSAHWNPYTYSTMILGFLMLVGFYFIEKRVSRPLIPNKLWQMPGFGALLISYFLGLGAYSEFLIPW
jgi:MFS family permease